MTEFRLRQTMEAEIERLRTENELLRDTKGCTILDQQEEITRLRDELHYANGVCNLAMKHRDAAEELLAVLDACAIPTAEQIEQMEIGFGAIFPPRMALELGMKTAIGNVRAAIEKTR